VRVGVLGGTFNPVHNAHLRLAEELRERCELDRTLLVPAGDPPLKRSGVAPARHRLEMLRRAVASNSALEVDDLELRRTGPSYTVDTLAELGARWPGAELWFAIGADTLGALESWHQPERLFGLANFAVATRPGHAGELRELLPPRLAAAFRERRPGSFGGRVLEHESGHKMALLPLTPLEISARDIRERCARGASIRYLVPDEVREYIEKHHLYRESEVD